MKSQKYIGKEKILFWNVDTQYDFMRNDESFKGALPVPGAREIENNLEKLTQYAMREVIQVVNTADWHDKSSPEISDTPDYVNTFPPHCLKGTKGAEYVPATVPAIPYIVDRNSSLDENLIMESRNIVIHKDAFDAFDLERGNPHTKNIVDIIAPDRIVVYGVATNYCVHYAVKGLADYANRNGKELFVVKDAIKELPVGNIQETFDQWNDLGVKYLSTEEVFETILK